MIFQTVCKREYLSNTLKDSLDQIKLKYQICLMEMYITPVFFLYVRRILLRKDYFIKRMK